MEHNLEIETIVRRDNFLDYVFYFSRYTPIQNKKFKIGVSFRNIGSAPISGATISNVLWGSAAGQNLRSIVNKSFQLRALNPKEEQIIWIGSFGTHVYGLCNITLDIAADDKNPVKTYQVSQFTKESDYSKTNSWIDFFYIRNKTEYEQSFSNTLVTVLAALSILLSVQTLKVTIKQTEYAEIQARSEKLYQDVSLARAREFCKSDPDNPISGVYRVDGSGAIATCPEVLAQ